MDPVYRKILSDGLQGQLDLHSDFIDLIRFPERSYQAALHDFLSSKYKHQPIDLVITIRTPPPNEFTTVFRNGLFRDVPVVYIQRDAERSDPNSTGVYYDYDLKRTLELALQLQPEAKQVFIVFGSSRVDRNYGERAKAQLTEFGNRVELNYVTDLTMSETLQTVAHLPPRSIVLYMTITEDSAGNRFNTTDSLDKITEVANAPVYATDKVFWNHGIVGGHFMDYQILAAKSAEMGLRVLRGEKPADIAIEKADPYVTEVDWRQLKRWNIDEKRVPVWAAVYFKQLTFWEQYKWRVVGALALIALQSVFIGVLLVERKRRQRARQALDRLNAELEERIAVRTAALDAKSRELETFAYSVAHDLKAPLRGIDGYSRLLLEDHAAELNDEGRLFLQTIHGSTEEMSQLIDDLLEYSRLERREFKPNLVELGPLITTIVEQKKREATETPIDFVVNVNGGSVTADQNGLIQSLRNYLDNAVKFSGKATNPRIEVGAQETVKNCLIWVRDNGVGFDMKYHDRIFDIFQRLNANEEYPGTGIGLAIVRKAMERMGGRAWAESQPGEGATFYLEIPKLLNERQS